MPHPRRALALLTLSIACLPSPVAAQTIGTFRWQLHPYCNLVTVVVEQVGPVYRLTGTDDQCGAGSAAAVNGEAHLTSGVSVALGFTIVTTPTGAPVHVSADITLPSANGSWSDSRGVSGNFVMLPVGSATGAPRPQPTPSNVLPWGTSIVIGGPAATSAEGFGVTVTAPAPLAGAAIAGQWGSPPSFPSAAAAVRGVSSSDIGVMGASSASAGVVGVSSIGMGVAGESVSGPGVFALSNTGPAVRAISVNSGAGVALELDNGGITVTGATRPVFRHVSTVGNNFGNLTRIDHVLTNLDPTAMLVVTHEFAAGAAAYIGAVGIYYDNTSGKWTIFREDQAAMPTGMIFNVLVVKQP